MIEHGRRRVHIAGVHHTGAWVTQQTRLPLGQPSIETAVDVVTAGMMMAAGSAVLTAGLLTGSARLGVRAVRAAADAISTVAGGSLALARSAAVGGIRLAGTVVTGADPAPDGGVQRRRCQRSPE